MARTDSRKALKRRRLQVQRLKGRRRLRQIKGQATKPGA
jgi:hypothetical protein